VSATEASYQKRPQGARAFEPERRGGQGIKGVESPKLLPASTVLHRTTETSSREKALKCYRTEEIDEVVQDTFRKVELVSFGEGVSWEWNPRFKATLGRANYTQSLMEFSSYLWPYASVEMRTTAVIHEACHLASMQLFGEMGHGIKWKRLMVRCGQEPNVRHSVGIDLNTKMVYCECSEGCKISMVRYRKMLRGKATYACNICNHILRINR
jgi:predicted SprT family Zn-dependent metalloprotease